MDRSSLKNTIIGMYQGLESADPSEHVTPELIQTFKTILELAKELFPETPVVKEMQSPHKCRVLDLLPMLGALSGAIQEEPEAEEMLRI